MGQLKIVRLHFRSALHLGTDVPGIGIEDSLSIAHSDTLFSCLINNYAELHSGNTSAVKKLLTPFRDGEPPFRISSAFPFQIQTYYLPKPQVAPPRFYHPKHGRAAKRRSGKLFQNTPLVKINTFKKWICGETNIRDKDVKDATGILGNLRTHEIHPQHASDRLTNATTIYHTGLVHFKSNAGLYFLVELNDMSLLDWDVFKDILTQAGRNGLGGRRSHGNGVFNVTKDTISDLDRDWEDLFYLHKQEGFNGFINLSLYLPEPETFDCLDPVAYQLVPRRGWCYSSITTQQLKRQTITMFSEGSVFRNKPHGALADVTPPREFTAHKLYRYGIPISLPIKILEEENDLS